jgi:hypothetical protein
VIPWHEAPEAMARKQAQLVALNRAREARGLPPIDLEAVDAWARSTVLGSEQMLEAMRAGLDALRPAMEDATRALMRWWRAYELAAIRAEAVARRPSRTGHRHRGTRAWHRRYHHR